MSRLPKNLTSVDFFKILEREPQEITIKDVKIKEDKQLLNVNKLELELELVETQQNCTHSWNITHTESSKKYYIGMKDDLHPLLAYESGIENNALIYSDDELVKLLTGLKFKSTARTETLKGKRIFTLIPRTELMNYFKNCEESLKYELVFAISSINLSLDEMKDDLKDIRNVVCKERIANNLNDISVTYQLRR